MEVYWLLRWSHTTPSTTSACHSEKPFLIGFLHYSAHKTTSLFTSQKHTHRKILIRKSHVVSGFVDNIIRRGMNEPRKQILLFVQENQIAVNRSSPSCVTIHDDDLQRDSPFSVIIHTARSRRFIIKTKHNIFCIGHACWHSTIGNIRAPLGVNKQLPPLSRIISVVGVPPKTPNPLEFMFYVWDPFRLTGNY